MNESQLKKRTKEFGKDIIKLCRILLENREGRLIGNQIFRSGTSVPANYRAACRGRSKAEFLAKLGIVEEEADETMFWLEIIREMDILMNKEVDRLLIECNELLSIFVVSIKTTRNSIRK
ncbi:four helix bundle protein [Bacteroidota bacterium]